MKKIISLIFALVLAFSLGTAALADEYMMSSGQDSTTTVQYDVPSQFSVFIPAVIDLTVGYTFQADYMNILDDEVVRLYNYETDDGITLTNQDGKTIKIHLNVGNCVAEFTNSQLISPFAICGQVEEGVSAAGSYTGTTTFIVQLETVSP